jgi:hypothetical protein
VPVQKYEKNAVANESGFLQLESTIGYDIYAVLQWSIFDCVKE